MDTTIDRFGRIVIPKKIRKDFNLKAGMQLRIEESEQAIILKPIHAEPNLILKEGVLVFSGSPTGNIEEALKKHRMERARRLAGDNENSI